MLRKKSAIVIYIVFLMVATFLPTISFDGYSILRHTTSHLGAQGSPYAWVMNTVFFLLGVYAICIAIGSKIPYVQLIGTIFGLSLLMTGVFQHAPLIEGHAVNIFHDTMHSIFASTTGFSFTLLAIGHAFMTSKMQRYVALTMGLVATIIPILMITFPDYMGLSQRIMFVTAFLWLFFYFKPSSKHQI